MAADPLVGGQALRKRAPRRGRRPAQADVIPPRVGWRFLGVLVLLGIVVMSAGVWRVQTVFDTRDLRIETSRLQQIGEERRDRARVLEARVSHLQQSEILMEAAARELGMSQPEPLEMETLRVASEARERWRRAQEEALGMPDSGKEE